MKPASLAVARLVDWPRQTLFMTRKLGRRSVLQGLGLAAVAGTVGLATRSRADSGASTWVASTGSSGTSTGTGPWGGLTPSAGLGRQYKILEIYLSNGFSQWESFWLTEPGGARALPGQVRNYAGLHAHMAALQWSEGAGPNRPRDGAGDVTLFSERPGATPVYLGPATKPLWRPDILSRTRLNVLNHNLIPHQAAAPYAMTGSRLGRPSLAGLGAPIQRYWVERSTGDRRLLPYSYVLSPASLSLTLPTEIGMHPGYAKPLLLDALRVDRVVRGSIGQSADRLSAVYNAAAQAELTAGGVLTRSGAFSDYSAAFNMLPNTDNLRTLLASRPSSLPPLDTPLTSFVQNCPAPPGYRSDTTAGLRLAAHLLTRPDEQTARYVCVLDPALLIKGHYDTHAGADNARITSSALYNLLNELQSLISTPGRPDPNKINLDDTLIILNTEFGRTPQPSGESVSYDPAASHSGREHWTEGYVTVFIGGPATRGISGDIDAYGRAVPNVSSGSSRCYTAADQHAAALLAAGINPFAPGAYNVGDMSDALVSGDVLRNLGTQMFGRSA